MSEADYSKMDDYELFNLFTDKQRLFVAEYLTSFNGTKAAEEAGYSLESCRQIASDTLSKAYIKEYVDRKIKEIIAQTDDKRAKLIQFWISIIDDPESSENAKLKASDSMGKYLAMFTEKILHSGDLNVVYLDKQDENI